MSEQKTPSEEFAAYCEVEFERRRNAGDIFDEALNRAAMELVLDKLASHDREHDGGLGA
jgi:hypothetical protein